MRKQQRVLSNHIYQHIFYEHKLYLYFLVDNQHFDNIHLHLYKKGKLLLQKTWVVFLISLLLILIILSCFAYSLRIIFNQKKVSEVKNDFINNMTHELKTPISTVSLALEALLSFDVRNDKQRSLKYLDVSSKEIRRLSTMVEKVLNIASYEKGEIQLNKKYHSINTLVDDVVEIISMQVHKKGGELNFELLASPDEVFVDKVHFNNLLYNLDTDKFDRTSLWKRLIRPEILKAN